MLDHEGVPLLEKDKEVWPYRRSVCTLRFQGPKADPVAFSLSDACKSRIRTPYYTGCLCAGMLLTRLTIK